MADVHVYLMMVGYWNTASYDPCGIGHDRVYGRHRIDELITKGTNSIINCSFNAWANPEN